MPFYSFSNPQKQSFEKMKNESGDVFILHMCTKNYNHVMYASWEMECDRHNFLSFWAIFFPFTLLTTLKTKIWKKYKKYQEKLSFHKCVPLMKIIRCMVPDRKGTTNRVFCPLTYLTTRKFKMEKMLGDIIILQLRVTNDDRITYDY